MPPTAQLISVPQTPDGQEVIVGVDTHKDFHVAAVVGVVGVLLGT